MKCSSLIRNFLIASFYEVCAIAFFMPSWPWPHNIYFGVGQDPVGEIWFLNWWSFALTHHLPIFYTHYADYPAGISLAWKTSIPSLGLLLAPIIRQFGAVIVYNILMISAPSLMAFSTYLAIQELIGAVLPSVFGGWLVGISSYVMGQDQNHLNLVFCVVVPLLVFMLLRAVHKKWHWLCIGGTTGILAAIQFGISQEVFCTAVLFGTITLVVVWITVPDARKDLKYLAPGLVAGAVICTFLIFPALIAMLHEYGTARGDLPNSDNYGNDLLSFFVPSPLTYFGGEMSRPLSFYFLADYGNYPEQGAYFSVPLLLFLGYTLYKGDVTTRSISIVFILAVLLSLGPHIRINSMEIGDGPWLPLSKLPLISAVVPCRMVLYAWIAAAFLVARELAQKKTQWSYAAIALCFLTLTPARSFDRNWSILSTPYDFSELPLGARVLIIPEFGYEMGLQYSSDMKFYLVGQGYLGRGWPTPFRDWPFFGQLWENDFSNISPKSFAAYLSTYGVQYVLVMNSGYEGWNPNISQADEEIKAHEARLLLMQAGWVSADGMLFTRPPHLAE